MIFTDNIFIETIEEYRKDSKMSIQELTKGIMSVKTYRRYLKKQTSIGINSLFRLVERLHANPNDIIAYIMFEKTGGVNFDKYLFSLIQRRYQTSWNQFAVMKDWRVFNEDQELLLSTSKKLYIGNYGNLQQKQELEEFLQDHISKHKIEEPYSIYYLSFLVIYMSKFPDNPYIDLETLIKLLTKPYYVKQCMMVYLMTVNGLITYAMLNQYQNITLLEPLIKVYQNIAKKNSLHYMISRGILYQAYLDHLKSNRTAFEDNMFRYAASILIKGDKEEFTFYNRLIQVVFHMDLQGFYQKHALTKI